MSGYSRSFEISCRRIVLVLRATTGQLVGSRKGTSIRNTAPCLWHHPSVLLDPRILRATQKRSDLSCGKCEFEHHLKQRNKSHPQFYCCFKNLNIGALHVQLTGYFTWLAKDRRGEKAPRKRWEENFIGLFRSNWAAMGWLRLVGWLKLYVSFAKEPYKRNDILQKKPIILRSLLIVATP